jgi:GT2 family glycosyltransferase
LIDALRRLFGLKPRMKLPCAAPLGEFLLLAVSRRRPFAGGRIRASEKFGRLRVTVHDLDEERAGDLSPVVPLAELLDQLVPQLESRARPKLLEFARASTAEDLGKKGGVSLAAALRLLRDRVREPLPLGGNELTSGRVMVVDVILALDQRSFWVGGWCVDDGTLDGFEIVSPEGWRIPLLEGAYRYARTDVVESLASVGIRTDELHAFSKYLQLPSASPLNEGWLGELRSRSGAGFEQQLPQVTRDLLAARTRIVGELAVEPAGSDTFKRNHARPALEHIQRQLIESVTVAGDVQHGAPPAEPEVSIVVPLYERIDLIEHQLAHFWQDPDFREAELIYVLDSPHLRESLARFAGSLHELYGISFRVLELSRNAGYSTANNLAAARARGRLLLLLNSDVLPDVSGWLSKLQAFYDATPNIGALGPKLLYEDDSIQHAGMYFARDAELRHWENQHYFKGFSRSLPAANVSHPVPAVTGACLMVERALYDQLGGLSTQYVQGGYEDSDLCLRLIEAGRRNWYLADVELYHLEAQSFPIHVRGTNPYNAWLQTHLWDDLIARTMEEQPETSGARVVAIG